MNFDDTIDGYFDGTGTGTPSRGGFWKKYRFAIIGLPVIGGVVALAMSMTNTAGSRPPPKKQESMIVPVTPMPPPPKVEPPPPEKEPEPEKEEMIKQEEIEEAPEETPPEDDSPPVAAAAGADNGFGLKQRSGSGTGRAATGPRRIGGKYDRYALSLQNSIAGGLRRHSLMKKAAVTVGVKIWVDSTGRITRAAVSRSSGDSAIDAALRSEILPGMQLAEPPPADMPMPINLEVTARRPN